MTGCEHIMVPCHHHCSSGSIHPSASCLTYNIRINHKTNVQTFSLALGSKDDRATVYEHASVSRGSATLIRPDRASDGHPIRVRTLDEVVSTNPLHQIRCVKIDVEGWELEVLKGSPDLLTSPNAPILLIEYSRLHPVHGGRPTDIYDLLRSANSYELYALTRGKAEPSALRLIEHVDQLPYHDNIFCFLPAHRRQLPSGILINEIA